MAFRRQNHLMITPRSPEQPRAVGVHCPYAAIPTRVQAWVEAKLGDRVVTADGQVGGMSPGCATRLRTADGQAAFVKAVGAELNPDTPGLFRREVEVLTCLPAVDHRPRVIATYDDGDWVALLLEDVDGRYPDLADPGDADAVWAVVDRQSRELTPPPDGLAIRSLPDTARRFLERWRDLSDGPGAGLPHWITAHAGPLDDRVATLPERLGTGTLCHWDIRDDNLLMRPDGAVVVLDWGMTCRGPWWADLFVLALAWADAPSFDDRIRTISPLPDEDDITDLLLLFGISQAWHAQQPAPPGLANLPEFTRRESERLLAGACRRLSH